MRRTIVAPVRVRGLKLGWVVLLGMAEESHPVRVRGLKPYPAG